MFEVGEADDPGKSSVIGHRSYIDDILIPADSWDQLRDPVDALLEACDKWNLSLIVVKGFWGMRKVEYLSHRVSKDALEANPTDLKALTDLAFPGSLQSMQSFLGGLNYYSRFIEDYANYAAVIYERREVDFAAMSKEDARTQIERSMEHTKLDQLDLKEDRGSDLTLKVDPRWIRAHRAVETLKSTFASTPILRHFDADREAVVIPLVQEYDQIYYPITFAIRTLKSNELNNSPVEKEVLALLRILDLGYNMLVGRRIRALTRYSTLVRSTGLQGRLGQWASLLSPWTLEIISPKIEPRRKIQAPVPVIQVKEELYVVGWDGSARGKRGGVAWMDGEEGQIGLCRRLEAEYNGLLLCLDLLMVFCCDSNLVIRQVKGEIDGKAPGLTLLKQKALDHLKEWPDHVLEHVKRDWNGSAGSLASAALQWQGGVEISSDHGSGGTIGPAIYDTNDFRSPAITRKRSSGYQDQSNPTGPRRGGVDLETKNYLSGDLQDLTQQEAKSYANLADDYKLDHHDLRFYCPSARPTGADRDKLMWLVIPETLYQDILHHYHVSLEGGLQVIGRTYQRIRDHFRCRGLYKSVQRYVGKCVDCETGKSKSRIQGESPGNLQATYPFQIIAMDHIPELLIFEDLFSGVVIAKASSSRTAQTVAESYEESSEAITHDREPGYMSDFFRALNKILGQRQRATMSYRPQANGSAERMVQTTTRAMKIYAQDLDQRDWDEYGERITFAINTVHDRIRGETPFYMVHGWDPRSTLEAVIPVGSTRRHDRDPRRWGYQIQRYCQQVREQVNQRLREAISDRSDLHNQDVRPHMIEVGSRVWLYLDRVKDVYAKTLAHLWHGPFRIAEKVSEHALKLAKEFPDRPLMRLTVESQDRLDMYEDLLPGDSWIQNRDPDEYEVEKITDMRSGRRTRYGLIYREFLVHWRGYDDPTWVDEADLNCGALLHEFLQDRTNHNRFGEMQLTRNREVAICGNKQVVAVRKLVDGFT
ncbi:Reverse transcriptase [Phytophthora palmivora]|uniref:Reverse transcriptase n=1 Tax=Phytophthora palmivora TaxID=4796 RepID=A0A2P4YFP0_9STRA|nr:Reverse transcriptase [Phytophthora palmivora]